MVGTAAVASPILSFFGATWGSRIAGRADDRLDKWRRREETGLTIRWAAEKAVDPDPRVRRVGFAAFRCLLRAELLRAEDRPFVRHVAYAAISDRVENAPLAADTGRSEG